MITNYKTSNYSLDTNPMHPKYGWQLMHAYNGYFPFTSKLVTPVLMSDPTIAKSQTGFHYLFYNRYTGQARFFTNVESTSDYDPKYFSLNFSFVNNPSKGYSGLFNSYNNQILALDEKSDALMAKAFIPNQNVDPNYINTLSDIKLSYDPCICTKTENEINELKIELCKRNHLNLYAEGKYAGITKQFDNSGKLPSSFGPTWLSSVYGEYLTNDTFKIDGGTTIYKTADSMASAYYVSEDMKFLSTALGLFGKVVDPIKIGTNITIGSLLQEIDFLPSSLKNDTSKIKLPLGNALSFGAKQLSALVNPAVPNVSFTEGQIALRGKITQDLSWGGFTSRYIHHPGSLSALNCDFDKYPYYNEAPGLMALVYTPKFGFKNIINEFVSTIGLYINNGSIELQIKEPIKYAINPASNIDITKSKLYSTIEFDYVTKNDNVIKKVFIRSHGFYSKFVKNLAGGYKHYLIQTRIVPLDKQHTMTFKSLNFNIGTTNGLSPNSTPEEMLKLVDPTILGKFNFRLKIMSSYEYTPNNYITPPQLLEVNSYKIKYEDGILVKPLAVDNIYPDTIYTSQISLTGSSTNPTYIKASYIIVDNNFSPPVNVILQPTVDLQFTGAGRLSPSSFGTTTIDPQINIWNQSEELHPISNLEIKSFCNTSYKANQSLKSTIIKSPNVIMPTNLQLSTYFSIYPNPTSSNSTLKITNPSSEKIIIKIYDLIGKEVTSQEAKNISITKNEIELFTEKLNIGFYLVKVIHGDIEQSLRLEVQK